MRKILIIVYSAFLMIMLLNYIYYKNLYNKQIRYISELLDRQVQIVGLSVDNSNNTFSSDLNQIMFNEDLSLFFTDNDVHFRTKERMKLFFIKYQSFVTALKVYDNNKHEFTLKKNDPESTSGEWLESSYVLREQAAIIEKEELIFDNNKYSYNLPVLQNNIATGNIVATIDFKRYFSEIFAEFNLKDYQWQWVVSDSGQIIYDNNENRIEYSRLEAIARSIASGSVEHIVHRAVINGKAEEIISSFYSTQFLQRELGLVFSAPTDFFQKYIIRNSLFIVLGTLILVQFIIFIFWRYFRQQKAEMKRFETSEKMFVKLIEEMPVGVIIHNRNREIIKANKAAADLYSYPDESAMKDKIFPETSVSADRDYFLKNFGDSYNPDQFIIIKKEIGEIVLFRNSITVVFIGEVS